MEGATTSGEANGSPFGMAHFYTISMGHIYGIGSMCFFAVHVMVYKWEDMRIAITGRTLYSLARRIHLIDESWQAQLMKFSQTMQQ